jgi:hypothetical protein
MKYNLCTYFDRNYLYKGLSLYNSLLEQCPDFMLWILCMDDLTFKILERMRLEKALLIKMSDFEDEELLKVKSTRSVAEYCWTCSPCLPWYILQRDPSLEMITYLDADLFFFGNPDPIYEEMGDKSIMIIEHRFPDHLKYLEVNGIYNVSTVAFRNNSFGRECLKWWRERCIEWCYYRLEDGKMGDQKYLDDWPTRFEGVHVLQHKGAGVALWNIMRYNIREKNGKIFVDDDPLIFYHFHQFSILKSNSYDFGDTGHYSLTPEDIRLIYKPYTNAIKNSVGQLRRIEPGFNYGFKYAKIGSLTSKAMNLPMVVKNCFRKMHKEVLKRRVL